MERMHESRDVDLKKASRGIWLVKVPKYLSDVWYNGPPGSEIGELKIYTNRSTNSTRAVFTINDTTQTKNKVLLEHDFIMKKDMGDQQLNLLSVGMVPSDPMDSSSTPIAAGPISIEGQVKQRCEFKPRADDNYFKFSRDRVAASNQPTRKVIEVKEAVLTYKPKADHDFNKKYEAKKKEDGKKVREDKDKVMDMLFGAFQKHQYYNIKDLGKITNQPMAYLKEILREICTYNVKAPYKNTWELKQEFRHYREGKDAATVAK